MEQLPCLVSDLHRKSLTSTEHIAVNPLNAELNPICHLLALLGTHHILHVSRARVNNRIYNTKLCFLAPSDTQFWVIKFHT